MDLLTFSAVIAAAAMHAGWNAFVKVRLDPLLAMVLITGFSAVLAAPALPFTGWPARESWPWLAASVLLHLGYYIALTEGYRRAEMSQIYPLARGGAPMLTALLGITFFGEVLVPVQGLAIVILGFGIMLISLASRRPGHGVDWTAIGFAAASAILICGYTLVDGHGARAAGSPHAYSAALFVLEGVPLLGYVVWTRGPAAFAVMRPYIWQGMAGGALSLGAYWIAIWAMTRAPIPLVAAARESSVLFAAAIAYFWLGERLVWPRIAACVLIVVSLVLLRAA